MNTDEARKPDLASIWESRPPWQELSVVASRRETQVRRPVLQHVERGRCQAMECSTIKTAQSGFVGQSDRRNRFMRSHSRPTAQRPSGVGKPQQSSVVVCPSLVVFGCSFVVFGLDASVGSFRCSAFLGSGGGLAGGFGASAAAFSALFSLLRTPFVRSLIS